MRILITNDDGIASEGLLALVRWAKKLGEVWVAAPAVEQSGKSHGIEIHEPFKVSRLTLDGDVPAYSVGSTPADCVRFVTLGLGECFDVVFSGINRGFNIGRDIVYSATVGAVFEAAVQGIPGVAFSTGVSGFEYAAAKLDAVWQYFADRSLLSLGRIYNVNIPDGGEEILVTRQGGKYYSDDFEPAEGEKYIAVGKCVYSYGENTELDTDAVMNRYISITPLTAERTAFDVFERLRKN